MRLKGCLFKLAHATYARVCGHSFISRCSFPHVFRHLLVALRQKTICEVGAMVSEGHLSKMAARQQGVSPLTLNLVLSEIIKARARFALFVW
jgi:hypothetical protein